MSATRTWIMASAFGLLSVPAQASPIVYDFTARLNQPVDGSNQVSGSFTLEEDYPGSASYTGLVDVHYQYPVSIVFADHSIALPIAPPLPLYEGFALNNPGGDVITTYGTVPADQNGFGQLLNYRFEFDDPSGRFEPGFGSTSLPILNLQDWTGKVTFNIGVIGGQQVSGTITNLQLDPNQHPNSQPPSTEPVNTPEPSMVAVFTVVGILLMARGQHLRRPRESIDRRAW